MKPPAPPKVSKVEVVAAQPSAFDRAAAADATVAYVVKVALKTKPPVTSMAWALYVGNVLIPKYWEYEDGIYFTVTDPKFFDENKDKKLRFSQDGTNFFDAGAKLAAPPAVTVTESAKGKGKAARLPTQEEVLK